MRFNYGGATAVLALFISVSTGGAYAASSPPPGHSAGSEPSPRVAAGRAGPATPSLRWVACPGDGSTARSIGVTDCATAAVPLDYDHPNGATIDIALKRRLADDPARRIGTLFVNPGGPGGSGVDMVSSVESLFPPRLLARFDVVGFDPRGIARSAPLVCLPTPTDGLNLLGALPPFPVTRPEEDAVALTIRRSLTEECDRHAGPILDHMGTGNAARDLDLLRAAVGDRELSYFGASYGTQLGTTYANLFPDRVRALVLDGNLDPIAWTTGYSAKEGRTIPVTTRVGSQRSAFETLERFFELCRGAGPTRCALASQDPAQRYQRLARQLRREPVLIDLGGTTIEFTYAHLVASTLSALYDPHSWAEFAALVDNLAGGSTDAALRRSYRQLQRSVQPAYQPYEVQSIEGFPGVLCADSTNPSDPRAWSVAGRREDKRSPYFGRMWTWRSIPCATWPGRDRDRYTGPWRARTANPVLVVGGLHDPATPYAGAETVAGLLPGARLLTLDGEGHVAAGLSACIDDAEVSYLLTKALPRKGTVCKTDVDPFPAAAAPSASADQKARERARRALLTAARGLGGSAAS